MYFDIYCTCTCICYLYCCTIIISLYLAVIINEGVIEVFRGGDV